MLLLYQMLQQKTENDHVQNDGMCLQLVNYEDLLIIGLNCIQDHNDEALTNIYENLLN
jgi:hypothetical protein